MLRFTIRDLVLLTVVVAIGVGWWADRKWMADGNEALRKEADELRGDNWKLALELAAARSFPRGWERMKELLEAARTSPLATAEAQEVLFEVRHGDDFRTRVRAMAILPYLEEREDAVEALRAALRDRGARSEDGVIPTYAATYLAELKATSAIQDVRAWVDFIKSEQPYDSEIREMILESSERNLAKLIAEMDVPDQSDSSDK